MAYKISDYTKIVPLAEKEDILPPTKRKSIFHSGVDFMQSIISASLALLVALFFIWLNGKQHEYDQLNNDTKKDGTATISKSLW